MTLTVWARRSLGAPLILATCTTLSIALESRVVQQTSVSLTFRGPRQEPVVITQALLLVTAWGISERHPVPVKDNLVLVDLEGTHPQFADRFEDEIGVIYVKAAGYAPVMSEAFTWPAGGDPAVIDFRNGRRARIARGTQTSLEVPLRRPLSRRVRLVDLNGRPVAGAKVEAAAYWPTPNHCGFMNGRDVLAAGSTNADGVADVPDIDGPHVFSLLEPGMLFADAKNHYPAGFDRQGLVVTLNRPETTLRVRRYEQQRLVVDIVRDGRPLPGAVLWADMGLGVCGAGYGPLAKADSSGRLHVDPFVRELWRNYWVCADSKQVWVLPPDGKLPAKIDVGVTPSGNSNGFAGLCRK